MFRCLKYYVKELGKYYIKDKMVFSIMLTVLLISNILLAVSVTLHNNWIVNFFILLLINIGVVLMLVLPLLILKTVIGYKTYKISEESSIILKQVIGVIKGDTQNINKIKINKEQIPDLDLLNIWRYTLRSDIFRITILIPYISIIIKKLYNILLKVKIIDLSYYINFLETHENFDLIQITIWAMILLIYYTELNKISITLHQTELLIDFNNK